MRRPSERLSRHLAQVAAKFTPDPQLYVVYWSEVEHDDPRAGTVEEQGNTRKICIIPTE